MIYGIDLDGVCFNFVDSFCKHLNDRLGFNISADNVSHYYWYEILDISKELFHQEMDKFAKEGKYRNLKLVPGALDALNRIVADGHDLLYITNRPDVAFEDTKESLKMHDFPRNNNLIFANHVKSKYINKYNISKIIEDSPYVMEDVLSNTDCKIYCYDYLYNRHIKHDNVIRIKDWDDFLLMENI